MEKKYNKEDILTLFRLYGAHDWIQTSERTEALVEMLEMCETDQEKQLIPHSIENFLYLKALDFEHALDAIVAKIFDDWKLPVDKVQLVATAFDSDADSSQSVLWMLKRRLARRIDCHVEKTNKAGDSIRKSIKFPYIVLIDEFIGTGQTFCKRIRNLRTEIGNYYATKCVEQKFEIRGCVIAAMEDSIDCVREVADDLFAVHQLRKGISDHFTDHKLQLAVEAMLRLEGGLEHGVPNQSFPSFGYGQAEALYGTEFGNTPNSVFPIFWWPYLKGMKSRNTLLLRG